MFLELCRRPDGSLIRSRNTHSVVSEEISITKILPMDGHAQKHISIRKLFSDGLHKPETKMTMPGHVSDLSIRNPSPESERRVHPSSPTTKVIIPGS